MKFDNFEEFQSYFLNLIMPLSMVQEEIPPELFTPLADAFLKEYKETLELFKIENNIKFKQKEAKFRAKLLRKGWKNRIRDEILSKSESKARVVKESRQSEPEGERINSAAVYAAALDNKAPLELEAQVEPDKASTGLIAYSSGSAGLAGGGEEAVPAAPEA